MIKGSISRAHHRDLSDVSENTELDRPPRLWQGLQIPKTCTHSPANFVVTLLTSFLFSEDDDDDKS